MTNKDSDLNKKLFQNILDVKSWYHNVEKALNKWFAIIFYYYYFIYKKYCNKSTSLVINIFKKLR